MSYSEVLSPDPPDPPEPGDEYPGDPPPEPGDTWDPDQGLGDPK